jgi:tetratricopeptide (TPR) repeat protein
MITRVGLAALAAAFAATPLAAQQAQSAGPLVAQAMFGQTGGKYVAPKCSADKNKHFKTSSAATYLSSAVTTGAGPKADDILENGNRVATEAIMKEGQDKAASAWFVLGRIQLFQGDLAGADSSLKKAEALAPDCKEEINTLRRTAYVALAQEGAKQGDAKNIAAASEMFAQATRIYPASPFAPYNLATLFSEAGQPDSALKYYGLAATTTSPDTNDAKVRKLATFNQAVVLLNAGRAKEAVPILEQYTAKYPDDNDAKRGLAQAYRASGQNDKARALDAQTGVSTAAGPTENTGVKDLLASFSAKDYAATMQKADGVLATDPYNTTALTAGAFSAYQVKDGPKLVQFAEKLHQVEPANEDALKLLSNGYKLTKQTDKATGIGEKILALPAHVSMKGFTLKATGATLEGTATGREALDAKSAKSMAPKAQTFVVEFTDKSGAVVSTQEVAVPALAKDQTHDFTVEGTGEGITGYRYKVKA